MTCKDCIDFDVCMARGDIATKELLDGAEIDCDFFKNKANFVEVVRCKDCKYWNNGDCYRLELSLPTDFCSYGERKSDG